MAIDRDYLLGLPPRVTIHRFCRRDTMLYALGVGAGQGDPCGDLRFTYEEGLEALPTMAVVLGYPGFWQKEPQYGIDWKRLLHGEQSVEFLAPLPVEGEVRSELSIEEIIDKGEGKGALLYSRRKIFDVASGDLLANVLQVSFLRGDGGCGGPSVAPRQPHPIPEGDPDETILFRSRPDQALLYRLSGDYNPLHADPAVAADAGLPRPILHGLCTYGIAGLVLLRQLCGGVPARLRQLDCRFTAPVFPGDEIEVRIWREHKNRAAFQVVIPGRELIALNNGYVEFNG